MKSSTGQHWIALDHIRALAAFMVFTWHFIHQKTGYPVPFQGAPAIFPLALLDEGHTGVALFMSLSGYLFAKLLDEKKIKYLPFFWNRFLRLTPLLLTVIVVVGMQKYILGEGVKDYLISIMFGILIPSLPNGGWSITVEWHFYIIMPFIIVMTRYYKFLPVILIILSMFIRYKIYTQSHEVQLISYFSIIGRIDQFLFGIFAFQYRYLMRDRHVGAALVLFSFCAVYWLFDQAGGFYTLGGSYPSKSSIWIVLPAIEGASYAWLISYYDNSFSPGNGMISRYIGKIGTYSYSIYLLHLFVVFHLSNLINKYIINISNIYLSCIWSLLCFIAIVPMCYLSYRFIEAPFLRFRVRYIRDCSPEAPAASSQLA